MRTIWDMKLACVLALVTGCAAAKSAVGSLISPKPNQITVVNEVHVPTPAPKHSAPTAAMVTGSVAGAVAGGMIDRSPLAIAAGAGLGAALGYVVHEVTD